MSRQGCDHAAAEAGIPGRLAYLHDCANNRFMDAATQVQRTPENRNAMKPIPRSRLIATALALTLLGSAHAAPVPEALSSRPPPAAAPCAALTASSRPCGRRPPRSAAPCWAWTRPGQSVKAGQVLVRLDARAAEQGAAASLAQAQAERAELALAQSDLTPASAASPGPISAAALERAETEFRAAEARHKPVWPRPTRRAPARASRCCARLTTPSWPRCPPCPATWPCQAAP